MFNQEYYPLIFQKCQEFKARLKDPYTPFDEWKPTLIQRLRAGIRRIVQRIAVRFGHTRVQPVSASAVGK
jgi:hypothetical protein